MALALTIQKVLLVDDHAAFLRALRDYIGGFPQLNVVGVAATGEQAVALAELLSPDLVLMDLDMPGIGGIEATRIIKSLPRVPQVVVLTLHEEESFRRAALEAAADFFIVKDRLHEQFPAILEQIVRAAP